ncbi:MAG: glycine cleavage system protein T [Planctomycetes bacterium RBG_16_43_13]|nr:MAG: glycine cleavage system protein T [Planctomycetes bacterium RBG_16_43_13]
MQIKRTPLYDTQKREGAHFSIHNGWELPEQFADPAEEYNAVRKNVGMTDLSYRARLQITGRDRVSFIHGMVTNDVKRLKVGEGCYAAFITWQGRMISDVKIYIMKDSILLDLPYETKKTVIQTLSKLIVMDDVVIKDASGETSLIAVHGPLARKMLNKLLPEELPDLKEYHHTKYNFSGREIIIARTLYTREDGYEIFASTDTAIKLWREMGAKPVGLSTLNILRIENGVPLWGVDMDESNIPTEAGIEERAISYSKGCYIGQEIIQRIKTYGDVARRLVGLTMEGDLMPNSGDKICSMEGGEVGRVTSAVRSPLLGVPIALGYVRREYKQVDTKLVIRCGDMHLPAVVTKLPFYKPNYTIPPSSSLSSLS